MVWTDERIAKARKSMLEWHGTPHYNCLRIKGTGVDCVNFVSSVLFEAGVVGDFNFGVYPTTEGQDSEKTALVRVLGTVLDIEQVKGWREEPDRLWFGDIAVFKTRPQSAHMAIFDGDNIWHAIAKRTVQCNPLSDWQRRIAGFYRIKSDGWKDHPGNVLRRLKIERRHGTRNHR